MRKFIDYFVRRADDNYVWMTVRIIVGSTEQLLESTLQQRDDYNEGYAVRELCAVLLSLGFSRQEVIDARLNWVRENGAIQYSPLRDLWLAESKVRGYAL